MGVGEHLHILTLQPEYSATIAGSRLERLCSVSDRLKQGCERGDLRFPARRTVQQHPRPAQEARPLCTDPRRVGILVLSCRRSRFSGLDWHHLGPNRTSHDDGPA